jgi:hypothetical protein
LAACAQTSRRLVCFVVALLAAGNAAAQTAEEPAAAPGLPTVTAALSLVAPEGCGSEADLATSITRRSDRIRIDPTSDRRLSITIRTDGALTRVELSLTQPTGRHSTRKLKASSCEEALEAAALVAAVSLDPAASTALAPLEENESPRAPAPPPVVEPPRLAKAAPQPPPPLPKVRRWSFGVVALGEAHWAPAPQAMLGPGVVLFGSYEMTSVLAPTLRAKGSLGFWSRRVAVDDAGSVRFTLRSLSGELCPVRLGVPVLGVLPCGFWTEGRLWVAGRKFPVTHEYDRPWRAYGGSLVAWYRPVFPVEIQAGIQIGATRYRDTSYLSDPFQYIHRVGTVYRALSVGAGVGFP